MDKSPKGKILYISSANPMAGPGSIAIDHLKALREGGYKVDFLTKNRVEGHPEIKFITDLKPSRLFRYILRFYKKFIVKGKDTGHYLFYISELVPPVKIKKILNLINDDYEAVIVFFWQGLLSYKSIEKIYDSISGNPKMVFLCVDYSPMTGGCHFMNGCKNYKEGCKNCPMFTPTFMSPTNCNVRIRKRINRKLKPAVFVNDYMSDFFKDSSVMKSGVKLIKDSMILDLDKFKPLNKEYVRKKIGISVNYKYIILFGCQNLNEERKGMKYLTESLKSFYAKLNQNQRDEILVVTIGVANKELEKKIPFKQLNMGYVSFDRLPEIYSAADIFLSPTVDDAGPSMVNQSIACGIPVVSFEIGTALEVIKNQGTGYCVPLKDTKSFTNSLLSHYSLSDLEKEQMSLLCRAVAEDKHSYSAFLKRIATVMLNNRFE